MSECVSRTRPESYLSRPARPGGNVRDWGDGVPCSACVRPRIYGEAVVLRALIGPSVSVVPSVALVRSVPSTVPFLHHAALRLLPLHPCVPSSCPLCVSRLVYFFLIFSLSPYEPTRPACHTTASRASSGRCHTLGSAVLLGHSTSIRSPLRSASAYSFCLRTCSPLRYPPLFLAAVQHLLEHPSPSRSTTPPPPFLCLSVLHRFASRLARFVACA